MNGAGSSKIQLFGDTMNTAARMESLGEANRIHLAASTAQLLQQAGKHKWLEARIDTVLVKGKGKMQTYWLARGRRNKSSGSSKATSNYSNPLSRAANNTTSSVTTGSETASVHDSVSEMSTNHEDYGLWDSEDDSLEDKILAEDEEKAATNPVAEAKPKDSVYKNKTARLVEWHVDLLVGLLKLVLARRGAGTGHASAAKKVTSMLSNAKRATKRFSALQKQPVDISVTMDPRDGITTLLNEVKEVIELPSFHSYDLKQAANTDNIVVSEEIVSQLRDFVTQIAAMYKSKNPFHNFEHASHVVMAVHKLLTRIVTPESVDYDTQRRSATKIASDLHDYTFGITSDPLTHFAIVLSALIHDVDHTGVSNGQLAKENPDLADIYRSQRYVEENSLGVNLIRRHPH